MKNSLVFGIHAVEALLKNSPGRISHLCVLKDRADQKIQKILEDASHQKIKVESVSRRELDVMVNGENHQGVIAICSTTKNYTEDDLESLVSSVSKPLFLILDGVQDPHNLGACLRSADAAGVTAVIAPRDKAVGITPTVVKVASGAAEVVPFIQVTNLARTMKFLQDQGVWLFGADAEAEKTCYETNLTGAVGIVLGAEGTGLRRLTREHCDVLIKIPMSGSVSSLNVSVAAGVLLFEAVRQRLNKR